MHKRAVQNIFITLFIFCVLGMLQKVKFPIEFAAYQDYTPEYSAKKFPLPVLLYSSVTTGFLREEYKYFKKNNLAGFIITTLPSNWNSDVDELASCKRECRRINGLFTENYLRTSIAEENLPCWDDEPAWVSINAKIKKIARFSRRAGFRGILIDTTAYNPTVWNPAYSYEQYNSISDELAEKIIYRRGREIMQLIAQEFPNAVIIITPAGIFEQKKKDVIYHNYYNWKHFFNGLLSKADGLQVVLLADNTEDFTESAEFASFVASASEQIKSQVDYPEKWFKTNHLSLSFAPFGNNDKYPRSSLEVFKKQLLLTQKYSQKYIVLRDSAQALWQCDDPDRYGLDSQQAKIPVAQTLPEYLEQMIWLRDPYLQAYFLKQQYKHDVSYFRFFLSRLFAILNL